MDECVTWELNAPLSLPPARNVRKLIRQLKPIHPGARARETAYRVLFCTDAKSVADCGPAGAARTELALFHATRSMTPRAFAISARRRRLRIGFMSLVDMAPL